MKNILFTLALIISLNLYAQEKLTNNDIITMHNIGLDVNIIISKINASPYNDFNTSVKDLTDLKSAGIDPLIIAAMLENSKVELKSGIFYIDNNIEEEIERNQFDEIKRKGGLAYVAAMGMTNIKRVGILNGGTSKNKISKSNSKIYFQFGNENNDAFLKNKEWFSGAQSPEEFEIRELKSIKNGRKREAKLAVAGVGAAFGAYKRDKRFEFEFEKLGNNRYRIILNKNIPNGEYMISYKSDDDFLSIWDFTVID